ncbi:DUF4142 domain-containing protein [Paucihalobacter sp.]|uniref:DUF4142 domain-containing protein n=1 Tax=Paucihalobacter sp. TaxID=2850405 RepID=UPI003D160EAF
MKTFTHLKETMIQIVMVTLMLSIISCGPTQNRDNTDVYNQGNNQGSSDRVDNTGMDNTGIDTNRMGSTGTDNTGIDNIRIGNDRTENTRLGNDRMNAQQQSEDAQFIMSASETNLKQIQMAQLAQQNGKTSEVRELGKMMEEAHTKSQKDLTALAERKNIRVTSSLEGSANDEYNELLNESIDDFDKAYTDMMISAHENIISAFEKASNDSSDKDIKNWATTSLPGLRKHLDHSLESRKKSTNMMYLEKN